MRQLIVLLTGLLVLLADAVPAGLAFRIDRFREAIAGFEQSDREHPVPPGSTLFVGSSTFTRWTTLEHDMAAFKAVNRGFGGSTIGEIMHYCPRFSLPAKPARIVFYGGTNDIGELHHSGAQVASDFERFVGQLHEELPDCEIYFVSLSVAPCRLAQEKDFLEGNRLIADFCKEHSYLHYIDVTGVMRDQDGRLRCELFGPDSLHMTRAGYELWMPILKKALSQK